jgi:uncharacterized membrane protein YkoI
MSKRPWIIVGASTLLLAAGVAAYVFTRPSAGIRHLPLAADASPPGTPVVVQGQPVLDLARALGIADEHVHGEVLKVELERDDDRFVYEIKVLAGNGRVREIRLDAHTGSLIEIEDD